METWKCFTWTCAVWCCVEDSQSVCLCVGVCACALGLLASVIPSTLLLITADSYADNFRNISSTDNVLAIVLSANFQTALESDCVARKGSNESSW